MLFVSLEFFFFFIVVLFFYWSSKNNINRKLILLISSYIFYASWDWRFLSLIILSSGIDYICGSKIFNCKYKKNKNIWLIVSIISNLSILGFFKYFNFFRESLSIFFSNFGVHLSSSTLDIILPVGISFFTFQSMSYTIDVYRGKIVPENKPLDFFLYVAFFPQLVAGPIVRAKFFLPQLKHLRIAPFRRYPIYILLFAIGFFKKVAISDNISILVDPVFSSPELYSPLIHVYSVVLYAIQIYCDFSGYTDMAIAATGLLGYRLNRNFAAPYLAHSITDFWHRWHISLSSWLRDYLYISLGGNRHGRLKTYRNLMITMGLGGLWHGASWNFVIWGLLHGLFLCSEKFLQAVQKKYNLISNNAIHENYIFRKMTYLAGILYTFSIVCFCWIFFRVSELEDIFVILDVTRAVPEGYSSALPVLTPYFILMLVFLHGMFWHFNLVKRIGTSSGVVSAVFTGFVFALGLLLKPIDVQPFIYFQF